MDSCFSSNSMHYIKISPTSICNDVQKASNEMRQCIDSIDQAISKKISQNLTALKLEYKQAKDKYTNSNQNPIGDELDNQDRYFFQFTPEGDAPINDFRDETESNYVLYDKMETLKWKLDEETKKSKDIKFSIPETIKIEFFGNIDYDQIKIIEEIGIGSFKSVKRAQLLNCSNKNIIKNLVVSTQKFTQLKKYEHYSMITEAEVNAILGRDVQASNFTPKVYGSYFLEGKLILITKLANKGALNTKSQSYNLPQKLSILKDIADSLTYLHSKGIYHNDIAGRNILLHQPSEWVSIQSAIGNQLSQPIYDYNSNILYKAGVTINHSIGNHLLELDIKHVKIKKNNLLRALLTDFGCCTFKDRELPSNTIIPLPIKERAPELRNASCSDSSKELKQNIGEKSEAFSFGMLILEVCLQENNRGLMEGNAHEKEWMRKIKKAEHVSYLAHMQDSSEDPTAIMQDEFMGLSKIHPKLAQLASDLLSYNPVNRPTCARAKQILNEISHETSNMSLRGSDSSESDDFKKSLNQSMRSRPDSSDYQDSPESSSQEDALIN